MNMTLSQLVARIESNNQPQALRFEPKFATSQIARDRCISAHKPAYMNNSTAEMICRTSWGLFQIMGENLYTVCGLGSPISHFMIDRDTQERAFYAFVRARGINYSIEELRAEETKRVNFARKYNGSSAYVANIKRELGI